LSFKEYMSEVLKYNRVTLGHAEKYFLNEIMAKPKSAYTIWDTRRKQERPTNYKNVHTRIKRLEKLNLIERVSGNFSRSAIKYQITTQGLFHQVSKSPEHELELLSLVELLDNFSDNIILKTLLLPYFEKETLRYPTPGMYSTIFSYLGECCRITLNACDRIKKAIEENDNKNKAKYIRELNEDLQWLPREFAFRLITKSPDRVIVHQLAKDNKFILMLNGVKREFNEAYSVVNSIRSGL
jgi:DNA-binding MarR family transcriptional regulator